MNNNKNLYHYLLVFHLLVLMPFIGYAQELQPVIQTNNPLKTATDSTIHRYMLAYLGKESRVGLSVGIYHQNRIATYHYGSTQKGKYILPNDTTIYEIGSISKTFTGTLLAQAVKDRKVKMEDDVRLYLTGQYPNLSYQGYPVRLSHLVSHISGLPNFLPDRPVVFQNTSPDSLPFVLTRMLDHYTERDFLNDLRSVSIDTIPGYRFRYSNSSPQLLKYVLEKVYEKPFETLLQNFILKPLKMNHTTAVFKNVNWKYLAKGYNQKGSLMPYIPGGLDAAGGLFSTIPDMLQYLKFHLNEKNEVVRLSHQVTTGDIHRYAIGLNWQEVITPKKHKKIWQSGGTFGFSSYCVLYPDLDMAIVILTNEADNTAQTELGQIAEKIVDKMIYK